MNESNAVILKKPTLNINPIDFTHVSIADIRDAILKGMQDEDDEIAQIVNQDASPTFSNTMLALEHAGKTLERAQTILETLLDNATSEELELLAQELSPLLSEHANNIHFNKALFKRIEILKKSHLQLDAQEQRLLDDTYNAFIRRGVNLDKKKQDRLRKIATESSQDALTFSHNILEDKKRFLLVIHHESELEGLMPHQLESARQTARENNIHDAWAFTLDVSSFTSLLTHCKNRLLRKKVWLAYNRIGCNRNQWDNRELVKKLVNRRQERAQILGYGCYADMVLTQRMAANKERVENFLQNLIQKYRPYAIREQKELVQFVHSQEESDFHLKPWDIAYYSRLLKLSKYKADTEKLRPYFELEHVIHGIFGLAQTLYGIYFKENHSISVWHKDVRTYEVYDADHSFLALLYADFHPRSNKKNGAWTSTLKHQYKLSDGTNARPHVLISMNFSKPTKNRPALLTLDEVMTFLHEFGHSLHEIFSQVTFPSQSGTNVYWDFVELPSQLMENYGMEKDFLRTFAFHYKTGKPLPDRLIDNVIKSRTFHAAMSCMRQIQYGLLDMAYYTLTKPLDKDIIEFEKYAWRKAQIGSQRLKTCMSTQFRHIMTGGYAAGYYSYKWAEVLDADAFSVFQRNGIFDKMTALCFRQSILEKGDTKDPNELYFDFRQQQPSLDALLHRDGIK